MQTEQFDTKAVVDQLLLKFNDLSRVLSKNTYVRDTTSRLNKLLEDAQAHVQIILIGKERVGKSSIINAFLGRALFPSSSTPTEVNTFVKYAENEHIVAHFYNGQTEAFSIDKLPFLVTKQNELSEIIHDHVDYLTVYVNHSILKNMTLIDTSALERTTKHGVYFSHQLLSRVDEICWVVKAGSPMPDSEVEFLKKVAHNFGKPTVIINKTDEATLQVNEFIREEALRYGEVVEAFYSMSARQAFEGKRMNQMQSFIDSNIISIENLFDSYVLNRDKKVVTTLKHISSWLDRLQFEIQGITQREPYLSALSILHKQVEEAKLETLRMQSDLAIVKTYEEDYKTTSNVFTGVQTLYQLLQVIQQNFYLRDTDTESFEEVATNYLQTIRTYRTVHAEYTTEWNGLKKSIKNVDVTKKEQRITLTNKVNPLQVNDKCILLNDKKAILSKLHETILGYEKEMLRLFPIVKVRLKDLANERLSFILNKVKLLNDARVSDYQATLSYVNKLHEFDCLKEAQEVLVEQIQPLYEQLKREQVEENLQVQESIAKIQQIIVEHLPHEQLLGQVQLDETLNEEIKVDFAQAFPIQPLQMTATHIQSELPEIPLKIVVVES